jgi:hypothetical protein
MRDERTSVDSACAPAPEPLSPAVRSLQARMAAYAMHARHDSRQTSAPGRAAFRARFEREVDPDGRLDPQERTRRAELARRAYFARLSLSAAKARRAKRAAQGGEAS